MGVAAGASIAIGVVARPACATEAVPLEAVKETIATIATAAAADSPKRRAESRRCEGGESAQGCQRGGGGIVETSGEAGGSIVAEESRLSDGRAGTGRAAGTRSEGSDGSLGTMLRTIVIDSSPISS